MLRPEQLSVSVSGPQESTAIIRDVDFSGQLSTLTLSMAGHDAADCPANREPAAWQPGAMVRLTVSGKARVFSG